MNTNSNTIGPLSERAILMRFKGGLPGRQREDKAVTADVKRDKKLGEDSGKWEKFLYPKHALAACESKQNQARAYHDAVTVPFDIGTGILPGVLIPEYKDRMAEFRGQFDRLVEETFLANPRQWIDWAISKHNGTFEPKNYPGCSREKDGNIVFDEEEFRTAMRKKFVLACEVMPIPGSEHFSSTMASLLGTDTESVNLRVRDAQVEGQRELLRRIMEPVKHMVEVLSKDKPRIFETLTGNIAEICRLAPALNLSGDPALDALVAEVKKLAEYEGDSLKKSAGTREQARKEAEAMVERLKGYSF